LVCIILLSSAQTPWRFHVSFEDGTGQRDTIWMVFDINATVNGVDFQLGEGTPSYNPNAFNAFMYNSNLDSTKTIAYPFSMYPNIGAFNIFAINCTFPVIIRWDTSLFHEPCLPASPPMNFAIMTGAYQLLVLGRDSTSPYNYTTNLFTKDSLFCAGDNSGVPQVPLFGDLSFILGYDQVLFTKLQHVQKLLLFPNPSFGSIRLKCNDFVTNYSIIDMSGVLVFSETFSFPQILQNYEIPIKHLDSGIYIVQLFATKKQIFYEKFIIKK
jgi:hypothetical protein